MISIDYSHLNLEFKHPFKLSVGTRDFTESVLIRLEKGEIEGFGEATLPPYLSETKESVVAFLNSIDTKKLDLVHFSKTLDYLDRITEGNHAVKSAMDMALHDLKAKSKNQQVYQMYDLPEPKDISTMFTIGLCSAEEMQQKLLVAEPFDLIKLKLGSKLDKETVEYFKSISDKPFGVDVNQGWKIEEEATEMCLWLEEMGAIFIEQPMPKTCTNELFYLKKKLSIPLIADESFQRLTDLDKVAASYSGINIKLSKCTGIAEAYKIIQKARELNLTIMLGCMSESSCAIAAAAHLAHLVDFVDLDSPQLIKNDPFDGVTYQNGKLSIDPALKGLGIKLKE